jgi:alpha-beta hydrolase superfamily lysophospholipase
MARPKPCFIEREACAARTITQYDRTMNEETFVGTGGTRIFVRIWRPEGKARGVVVINHGFKSHSGLYGWVAHQLVRNALAVYALDMRGHGKSEGERLYVDKFDDYADDLAKLVGQAKQREQDAPTFVLGHSAGGVVACIYTLDHQKDIAGLICESFAHELPAPDFALAILKGVGHVAPHAHVLKLNDEDFSRDPKFVEQMKNDPLIPKQGYEAQTIAALVRADERLKREFPRVTLPLLILHGTADRAAKPHGSKVFHQAAGSKDKTLKLYEGGFHDLLNDADKEKVMADITEWMTTRLVGTAR